MPSLGGTALAVGCLSESMEGALREHGVLRRVAHKKSYFSSRQLVAIKLYVLPQVTCQSLKAAS